MNAWTWVLGVCAWFGLIFLIARIDERRRRAVYRAGWEAAMRQQNVPEEQQVDPPEYP